MSGADFWTVLATWQGALVSVSLLGSAGLVAVAVRQSWRGRRVRHRTRGLVAAADAVPAAGRASRFLSERAAWLSGPAIRRRLREAGAALGVAAFAVVFVGGVTGWLLAGAGAYGVRWWLRRRTALAAAPEQGAGDEVRAEAAQLPLAAELLAACLAAGSGPAQAADAVGRSLGGSLGMRLIRTATELRLGAEPAAAWGHFAPLPGSEGLVRSMERAGTAGAPAVDQVARLTVELRARRAREASGRARRAAVLVTGPLGLCFLPAFLAVGVAPVVMGLAESLL